MNVVVLLKKNQKLNETSLIRTLCLQNIQLHNKNDIARIFLRAANFFVVTTNKNV